MYNNRFSTGWSGTSSEPSRPTTQSSASVPSPPLSLLPRPQPGAHPGPAQTLQQKKRTSQVHSHPALTLIQRHERTASEQQRLEQAVRSLSSWTGEQSSRSPSHRTGTPQTVLLLHVRPQRKRQERRRVHHLRPERTRRHR